jgi:hypothetical protein
MQTFLLPYLKGLLAPSVAALEGIKFLLAVCKKGLATSTKRKTKKIHKK